MGRVIVIGAGPAGMMAAIFAARAGARVLLCGAPGMGDSLAVKVRCGLGSGNH